MMISTRGRYALRVMVDLAELDEGNYISMKTIAERQNISLKYLERILPSLRKAGLIEGVQGKSGGYRLSKKPEKYTVGEILRTAENDLAPVACLAVGAKKCPRKNHCRTIKMWEEYQKLTNDFFDNITLVSLCKKNS